MIRYGGFVRDLEFKQEQTPLKYHETITQMIPDLSTRDKHDLKVSSLPTLKKIVYYSTTESTDGAFTFDEFGDSADRSHHNILESITIR